MLNPSLKTRSRWHGAVKLAYQKQNQQTQPITSYAQAPYKLQRPFYPQGKPICYTTLLHTAGGIVGGDALSQSIQLHPNSEVVLTTAAASKIYRSNGLTASQKIDIEVADQACLEYLPRETILFRGAQYQQQLTVNLAASATWLGWEIVRLGRSARGERFSQGEARSRTEIWQNGKLVWVDCPWLLGEQSVLESPHGFRGYPLVGTLVWVGKPVSTEGINALRQLWQNSRSTGEAGVTALMSGVLCRYRGNSRAEVIDWFINAWRLFRQWDGKETPVMPRVWRV